MAEEERSMDADGTHKRVYYLENEAGRFWEVTVDGAQSVIRCGKVGCKGRTYPPKLHKSTAKCRHWGLTQTNGKRMEGYLAPEERTTEPKLKRRITDIQAERLGLSRQDTAPVVKSTPRETSVKRWRKPPRKQSTIRRAVAQASIGATQRYLAPEERTTEPKLKRRITDIQVERLGLSRQDTAPVVKSTPRETSVKRWRKPPRKQSTIRRVVKQASHTPANNSVSLATPGKNKANAPRRLKFRQK